VADPAAAVAVEFFGVVGMGAQRWIDLGFMRLQPSELMKITLVMAAGGLLRLAAARPRLAPGLGAIPAADDRGCRCAGAAQPDLGTAILLLAGGGA
jgi:rod shape determining protein RodA